MVITGNRSTETSYITFSVSRSYREEKNSPLAIFYLVQISSDALKYLESLLETMSPFTTQWENELRKINHTLSNLPITSLCLAIASTYLGMVSTNDQRLLMAEWQKVVRRDEIVELLTDDFIRQISEENLSNENEMNQWSKKLGLEDMVSRSTLLNARTCLRFGQKCWPLLLDPFSEQAEAYVRLMENNYETRENSRPTQFNESDGKIVVVSGDSEIIGEW